MSVAMKTSAIFPVFHAGQAVGWNVTGAALNLKVLYLQVEPAVSLSFLLTSYLVLYFHGACPPDVRIPLRLFVLSLFVLVSFLTCLCRLFFVPWYGLYVFNTALASCTIVQILLKYSFHSLLKVAHC
jgi:hypothetical protein